MKFCHNLRTEDIEMDDIIMLFTNEIFSLQVLKGIQRIREKNPRAEEWDTLMEILTASILKMYC